jgi:UDP-N-acetylglucosamine diphosphorylase / glucose-1-phosphate thymidylyltransferase / UDP-N-acetylgalactosamine diphosphorylase / glucosamine-1-phosphate N-acetyltransferase / galactosamine-1-phosphate N-acetyltransferase
MQKIIFTEEYCKPENLHPFTYTRHIQDIRIGILTIRQKWEHYLKIPSADKWENHYLDNEKSVKIEKGIGKDDYLLVHANVLPTAPLISRIKRLKNGEFLSAADEGGIAYKFSSNEVLGLHKIKINHSVSYRGDVQAIHYPWQIFQLNNWALNEDFLLLTAKRKSKPIAKTNKVVRPSQVFLEAGVKMDYCFLNAEEGPIYIGKNATVMEGAYIKGPVAICEGAMVKIRSRHGGPVLHRWW